MSHQNKQILRLLDFFRNLLFRFFKNEKMRTVITKFTSYEVVSYLFFGVLTTLVDAGIYYALIYNHADEVISNIISSTCAILFAYFTNRRWVFESHASTAEETLTELIKFFEARIATLVLSTIIIWIFKLLHWNPYIGKIIAMVLTVVLNYIFSKVFIFTSKKGNKKNAEHHKQVQKEL
ncbi:MAG: GtrA family protein [Eubacterium sp.]|nr:GtrA family protein [Eubacterium sp.]